MFPDGRVFQLDDSNFKDLRIAVRSVAATLGRRQEAIGRRRSDYKALASKMRSDSFWNDERLRAFCNGRGLGTVYPHLGELIEAVTSISDAAVSGEISRVAPDLASPKEPAASPSGRSLLIEFGRNLEDQMSFCGEYVGDYLILRKHGEAEYGIAHLRIGGRYVGDIATFKTTRRLRDGSIGDRSVRGIIYRTKGIVYAIGMVNDRSDLRLTALTREQDSDLVGSRLGITPNELKPFHAKVLIKRLRSNFVTKIGRRSLEENYTGIMSDKDFKKAVGKLTSAHAFTRIHSFKEILEITRD